jgi:hypothetical protein
MTNRNIENISRVVLGVSYFKNLPFRVNRRVTSFMKKSAEILKEIGELRDLFEKEEDKDKKAEIEQELLELLNKETDITFDLPNISDFDNVENETTKLQFVLGEEKVSITTHGLINHLTELGFITE